MFRENYYRRQPGNYHKWGTVIYVTDDFGNAVKPFFTRWVFPEYLD